MRTIDFLFETLSHFVRLDDSPPPGVPVHANEAFERELVKLCEVQDLSPVLFHSLQKLTLGPRLSVITIERLKEMSKSIQQRNRQLLALGERVGEAFGREGISHCFLGDALFARNIYPSTDLRCIKKIDLLVRESDWCNIGAVMRSEGLVLPLHIPSLNNPGDALNYHQYYSPCTFGNKKGDIIKLRFRSLDYGPPAEEEPIWKSLSEATGGGGLMISPSDEDQLIGSVLEWNMSGFGYLLGLVDIALQLKDKGSRLQWDYIESRLRARGFYSSFYFTLEHASRLLKKMLVKEVLPNPGEIRRKFFGIIWHPEKVDYIRVKPSRKILKFYLLGGGCLSGRVEILKQLLAPNPDWVSAFFGRPYKLWFKLKFIIFAFSGKTWSRTA